MANKVVRAKADSNPLTGIATVTVKIPGVYQGINFKDPVFQGRIPVQMGFFFEQAGPGDVCTNIYIEDTDGKIAVPLRAQFPLYPIIQSMADGSMPAGNQGFYIPPTLPFQFPQAGGKAIASELYFKATFQKFVPLLDSVYVNIVWDDLT